MDRRSWLWRRKSSETESSGSVSSHSERFSEDQEGLRVSSVNASPNNARSPEVSSKLTAYDPNETIKSLNEKLSAALLSINAKEELVQQHVKVAEEAVAGWEKAEADVAALKKQLEVVSQKNSALEDRTKQLDAALKECVRQSRQSREEQERNFREALTKKTKEWENENFELETQMVELQAKLSLEVKAETASSIDHQVSLKLKELEKEKSSLRMELLARTEDFHLRTLERDLSTQAAETASKQHLESIKKLAKLEAECRRLRAANRKFSPLNDHIKLPCCDQKHVASSFCVESLTDSQSDGGERLITLDNEPSCLDSCASALIAELDQFQKDKATNINLTASAIEFDLMDDFLEMERLAALPEADLESSSLDDDGDSNLSVARDGPSRMEVEDMHRQLAELKQKIAMFEAEKVEMEMALSESRSQLKVCCDELIIADNKLIVLQQELNAAVESKQIFDKQMGEAGAKRKELESQLESAQMEISKLNEKASLLEEKLKEEEAHSAKLTANMEDVEANRKTLSTQLESANVESVKLKERVKEVEQERAVSAELAAKCQHLKSQLSSADFEVGQLYEKVRSLEEIIDEERASLTAFKAQAEASMEAKKIAWESQIRSAQFEVEELHKRASLLERKVEEERAISTGLAVGREELEVQLESAHLEVERLQGKVSSFDEEVDKEKSVYGELPIKKQDQKSMLRKEKDLIMASEMFIACQKTIDSISQQLKSLHNFENLILESEMSEPSSSSS